MNEPELPAVIPATTEEPPAPEVPTVWPAVPAEEGVVYGFMDPNHGDASPMVAMTLPTWERFTQQMGTLKSRLATLSQENIEMKQGRHPDSRRIILPGH